MKSERIERDFDFKVIKQRVSVHLTHHLFCKRIIDGVTDTKIRAHIFKSRDQYENLFTAAIKKYGLLSYANKGKVAFLFNAQGERYGLLLDVVTSEVGYLITVVTLDKIGERHYINNAMFGKEKNKIYTEYKLPMSFIEETANKVYRSKAFSFYHTNNFEAIYIGTQLENIVSFVRLYDSIVSRFTKGTLGYGIYWFRFAVGENKHMHTRVSIERIKTKYEEKHAVMFVGFESSFEKVKELAERESEAIVEVGVEVKDGFGIKIEKRPLRSGLRIKKKENKR